MASAKANSNKSSHQTFLWSALFYTYILFIFYSTLLLFINFVGVRFILGVILHGQKLSSKLGKKLQVCNKLDLNSEFSLIEYFLMVPP